MQQIKIFKGIETEIADLENRVNAWLKETGARVLNTVGNIAPQSQTESRGPGLSKSYTPSDILIILLYELP